MVCGLQCNTRNAPQQTPTAPAVAPVALPAVLPVAPVAVLARPAPQRLAPLTAADVARQLGVAPGTVRSWVSRGKLTPLPRTARNACNTFDPAAVAALSAAPVAPAAASQPDQMEGGYA